MNFVDTNRRESEKPLLLERISKKIGAWLRTYCETFASALIFGLLAHMFMLVNKLPNHDDVFYLFGKGATVSSGRWGLELISVLLPDYSMPWFHGMISLLLLALVCCLIVDLFSVRTKLFRVLLAGLIVSFPSQVGIFGYMFTSSAYALAFFLAVLAVYLLIKAGWIGKVAAVLLLACSVGIYQTYLMAASSLLLVYMIKQLLADDLPWKTVLKNGIGYVLFLAAAFAVYYAILFLMQTAVGTGWSEYAVENITTDVSLLKRVYISCLTIRDEIVYGYHGLVPTVFSRVLYGVCVLHCAVVGVLWAVRKRNFISILFAIGLALLLPVSINGAYLISNYYIVHIIMLHSFVAVFIVTVVLAENTYVFDRTAVSRAARRVMREAMAFSLAALLAVQVFVANEKYLSLHLAYENIYAYYTTLIGRVQSQQGYDDTMRMALVGRPRNDPQHRAAFDRDVTMIMGTGHKNVTEKMYSKEEFIRYYIGSEMTILSDAESERLAKTEAVQSMPCYPNDGSICIMDDIVIVKLSEETDWTSQ